MYHSPAQAEISAQSAVLVEAGGGMSLCSDREALARRWRTSNQVGGRSALDQAADLRPDTARELLSAGSSLVYQAYG